MPTVRTPGVFIEELPTVARPIAAAPTGVAAFVGRFRSGPTDDPVVVHGEAELRRRFGEHHPGSPADHGVLQFFRNGGARAVVVRVTGNGSTGVGAAELLGDADEQTGVHALADASFDLLCLPGLSREAPAEAASAYLTAIAFCTPRFAFVLVDAPEALADVTDVPGWLDDNGLRAPDAAVYVPRLVVADPRDATHEVDVAPSGAVAGVYARTDRDRGVWKAPAGTDAGLRGVTRLLADITDPVQELLNPAGVNAIRRLPQGVLVWGGRTLAGQAGADAGEQFVPVRRLTQFLRRSIHDGLTWVVLEPNDEPLWARVRLAVEAFLASLFRDGAFAGRSPDEAFFVTCGRGATMTQQDVDAGRLVLHVGVAPLRPAEFVVLRFELSAGES